MLHEANPGMTLCGSAGDYTGHIPQDCAVLRLSPDTSISCRLLNSSRVKLPLALELRPLSVRTTSQGGASERQPVHVAWAGESSSSPGVIDIPSALASCLRIEPGSRLQVPLQQAVPLSDRAVEGCPGICMQCFDSRHAT